MREEHYSYNDIPEHIQKSMNIPKDESYKVILYPFSGIIQVFKNDILHNDSGPAVYSAVRGEITYYENGRIHRRKGPAVINSARGILSFYLVGKLFKEEEIPREDAEKMILSIIGK